MFTCTNIKELHRNVELVGAFCLFGGLIAMQLNNPSLYTQLGIYCWATAQIVLVVWWAQRLSNAHASVWMGIFNIGGSLAFLAGGIANESALAIFISCAYIVSSSLQLISGMVRLPSLNECKIQKMASRVLARKALVIVACFQALAAMCFIVLLPVAGMFYTVAAFLTLTMNLLTLQHELMKAMYAIRDEQQENIVVEGAEFYVSKDIAKRANYIPTPKQTAYTKLH